MSISGRRFLAVAAIAVAAMAAGNPTQALAEPARPSFSVGSEDSLLPGFRWDTRTYAARCNDGDLSIEVGGAPGWRTRINGEAPRPGNYGMDVKSAEGSLTTISFDRHRSGSGRIYRIRCLPDDFPGFTFERIRKGGPKYFVMGLRQGYAVIFSRSGAPVWWKKSVTNVTADAKVLPDGTVSWNTAAEIFSGSFEIRSLRGRLLRRIGTDASTDVHDIDLLPNGNYLVAKSTYRRGIDFSAFGGPVDASSLDVDVQVVTPANEVVGHWKSADHIAFSEAGRWWAELTSGAEPLAYDVSHWNAAAVDGKFMYLSFRNADAIYKVNRKTGRVVWKLGGTTTPRSLELVNGPADGYPLGGQHDVHVLPDKTITVFNNRTDLAGSQPRAQRFRIDEDAGTAKIIGTIRNERVGETFCCGSAQMLPSKEWLVSWGNSGLTGAYDEAGRPLFRLDLDILWSYRANAVPDGVVSALRLRKAMNFMNR